MRLAAVGAEAAGDHAAEVSTSKGSSAEVDKAVRSLVEHGLAVYDVNADALEKLKPDVILTQDQCEVCAVSLADVERAVCQFVHGQPRIVSMRPHTLADVYSDIARVAEAIGRPEAGKKLIASMQDRFAAIAAKVAGRPKKKLAFIEWVDPPMSGGHWMPELIDIAGGVSVFGRTASHRRGSPGRRSPPPTRTSSSSRRAATTSK